MRDVAAHHPEATRLCILLARDLPPRDSDDDSFDVVPVKALGLPSGEDFLFDCDLPELLCASLPWIFEHLFSRGHDFVVFIAPPIRLYRSLDASLLLLETSADVVVTPHFISPVQGEVSLSSKRQPIPDTCSPDFFAIRRSDNTRQFLHWWRQGPIESRWLELLPALCDRVVFLRHPGYNVAPWNVRERRIRVGPDGRLRALDQELVFFNFGDFSPEDPLRLMASPSFRVSDPTILQLAIDYSKDLQAFGSDWYTHQPYVFGMFSDGGFVTSAERRQYRRVSSLRTACGGDPFAHPELLRLKPERPMDDAVLPSTFTEIAQQWRLQNLSEQLLGRPASSSELLAWQPWIRSRSGMIRLLLAIGLCREARRTPGWLARLLDYIARSPMADGPLREFALQPLIHLLSLAATVFPMLAYRPCVRSDESLVPLPHPKQAKRHRAPSFSARTSSDTTPGLNIFGHFSREIGIGEAARSLARSCREASIPVCRVDVDELFTDSARPKPEIIPSGVSSHPIDVLYFNADVTLAAGRYLRALGHHSGYRIGFWHWEQPTLPKRFHEALAELDEVWVPSAFVHEAIASIAPVPVVTIPHAVHFTPTPGVRRSDFGLPQDKCLVLVMYDFHSFQERKNPSAAIAAFRAAKVTEPSLALVIKTINAQHHQRERQELEESLRDLADVTFIDAALSRQQAWDLEMCCDILLSLHRAEGFGLILAEMMFLGKPVVATGWSANMDFMNASNSVPVAFRLEPLARPVGPYEAGIPWAEPDVDHAAAALRRLATDRDLAASLGGNARDTILQTLAPAVIGRRVRDRLDVISRWFPRAAALPPR